MRRRMLNVHPGCAPPRPEARKSIIAAGWCTLDVTALTIEDFQQQQQQQEQSPMPPVNAIKLTTAASVFSWYTTPLSSTEDRRPTDRVSNWDSNPNANVDLSLWPSIRLHYGHDSYTRKWSRSKVTWFKSYSRNRRTDRRTYIRRRLHCVPC